MTDSAEPPVGRSEMQSPDGALDMNRTQAQEAHCSRDGPGSSSALHLSLSSSLAASTWSEVSTPATASGRLSDHGVESLRSRLKIDQLERQLAKHLHPSSLQSPAPAPSPGADSDMDIIDSRLSGTIYILSHKDVSTGPDRPPIAHGLSLKTRLLGQSHWAVSTAPLVRGIMHSLGRCEGPPDTTWTGIEKCKSLARHIKARRIPTCPPSPASELPPKDVCDTLVDNYLRTTECIYRILHLPTFRKEYEALLGTRSSPNDGFLAQLKLILAIGAVTYDDRFSLRTSAIRWVYEAQSWFGQANFKFRLNIRSIQNNILLLFAQERVGVRGDSTWVSSGALLRKAMQMGLHIDPSRLPVCSVYDAEMRRRLWNSLIEVNLQFSLTSGGAPLISLADFNTAAPGNLDDEQLEADGPVSKPVTAFTQVSIAIALRQTFPQRLAVVKFLNDLRTSPSAYDLTLRLDAELRDAYKGLSRTLRSAYSSSSSSPPPRARPGVQLVDFLIHRYLLSLHAPYFGPSLSQGTGTAYASSQKAVVESSIRLWRAACPHPAAPRRDPLQQSNNHNVADVESDIPRLACCSSGFYQTAALHAAALMAMDLRAQLQEEGQHSLLGPTALRPDLVAVLADATAWCLRVIEAGETNVKAYLLMSLVAAQIGGIMAMMDGDQVAGELVRAARSVEETCLPVLERMAEGMGMDATGVMETGQEVEDWALSWVFNDDVDPGELMF